MAISCFSDKNQPPSPAALEAALGSRFELWEQLSQFILLNYQMAGEWNFGGKNYGWNLWYRKSGKSLISLYPQQESLVAQVILGRKELEKALLLSLGEKVGKMVRETPLLHDGKWLFIPVTALVDEQDVQQLLLVKKRPVKR